MPIRSYHTINRTIKDGIQKALTMVTDELSKIGKSAAAEAASEIDQAWRQLASEKLGGRGKHLARYLDGIQPAVISGNKVQLKIRGHQALQVEMGWAPPDNQGAAPEDGLGTYDGQAHDMRPFLLWGKDKWNEEAGNGPKTSEDGFAYKVVKMPFEGASHSDFTNATHEYLQSRTAPKKAFDDPSLSPEQSSASGKRFKARVSRLLADARQGGVANLASDATDGIPASRTILWSETMENPVEIRHRNYLFKGLRATHAGKKGKYSFHLLRTISNDPKQADLWQAVGIAPAGVLEDPNGGPGPLIGIVADILVRRGIEKAVAKLRGKTVKVKG